MNDETDPKTPLQSLDYEEAKTIAVNGDQETRRRLAASESAPPEILYFLASDESVPVRKAVATNLATPVQADFILSNDAEASIRMDLASKIGLRLGYLEDEIDGALFTKINTVLGNLISDQLPMVRAIVAEEVKQLDNVPKGVIAKLARDAEASVSVPILEHSRLLEDAELIEIITDGVRDEAVNAIAKHDDLTEQVLRRMAGFVAGAIVEELIVRYPLSPEAQKQLRNLVKTRVETADVTSMNELKDHAPGYRILLADDDGSMRSLIRHMIEAFLAADVSSVDDGDKALAKIEEGPAFDLIICDWMMPSMNGIDVLRALRERGDDTPFVMLTARKDVDSIVAARNFGVDAFVTKPVSANELQSKLRVLMR